MKTLFFIWGVIKLFFFTSSSATSPATNGIPNSKTEVVANNVTIIHLTEASFKEMVYDYEKSKQWKYEGKKPAIIDFYADWCAPCRQLSPIIEELARDYQGKIIVYTVDTEKENKLARNIGISALPTLLFIPMDGKPQVTMGVLPKASLVKAVNDILLVK